MQDITVKINVTSLLGSVDAFRPVGCSKFRTMFVYPNGNTWVGGISEKDVWVLVAALGDTGTDSDAFTAIIARMNAV